MTSIRIKKKKAAMFFDSTEKESSNAFRIEINHFLMMQHKKINGQGHQIKSWYRGICNAG
jgi:hypothetical protein